MMLDEEMNATHEESEPESESSEQDQEVVKLTEPSKNAVYNVEGLLDKLREISLPDGLDWIHKLDVNREEQEEVDVSNNLARDFSFYMQALECVRQAYLMFHSMGHPFLRPSDYFADMVKSDAHMEKIKGVVLKEMKKIEEVEERRRVKENKKLAKEVQAQKMKEKAKQKKEEIEAVKKWRKQRQQSRFDEESIGDLDLAYDEDEARPLQRSNKKSPRVSPGDRSGVKATFGGKKGKVSDKKRKSREFKNSKFGFGGRKGLKKQNTAETTDNFRGFNSYASKKKVK